MAKYIKCAFASNLTIETLSRTTGASFPLPEGYIFTFGGREIERDDSLPLGKLAFRGVPPVLEIGAGRTIVDIPDEKLSAADTEFSDMIRYICS